MGGVVVVVVVVEVVIAVMVNISLTLMLIRCEDLFYDWRSETNTMDGHFNDLLHSDVSSPCPV